MSDDHKKPVLSPERAKAMEQEAKWHHDRLFAFLAEAREVLSDEAYMDMTVVAGKMEPEDRDLYHRLREALQR